MQTGLGLRDSPKPRGLSAEMHTIPILWASSPQRSTNTQNSSGASSKAAVVITMELPPKRSGRYDLKSKADILNKQFSSVFTQEPQDTTPDLGESPYPTMPDISIHTGGVTNLLRNIKPHKTAGPDNISARILKETADQIAPTLFLVFQASLMQGCVPDDWKLANVAPIFKKDDRSKASNYKPVSLTCISCKLLEHIVSSNVMSHLEAHDILTDAQHGFRRRRSCETQLILIVQGLA